MSSSFEDRQRAYEAEYSHNQEQGFRVQARRNKLFGLWAAEQMGLSQEAANSYALEVVDADLRRPGDDDVLDKVHGDLARHGIDISRHRLNNKLQELARVAYDQITR